MNKLMLLIIFSIILLAMPMISAETSDIETFEFNQSVLLGFTCTLNNAIPSSLTEYNITISYPNGTALVNNVATTPLGNGAFSYPITFTEIGLHKIQMFCYDGTYSFSGEGWYDVTPNGQQATVGTSIFYVGILLILVIFLIGTVVIFMRMDNLLARVSMIGLGYLLLIAVTFISWNMASDFLMSAPFLVAMLRILFFVLMAGLFPLLLGGFAWYFFMLFKINEIQRLMNKGMSEDEAERRQGRKYK